MKADRLYLFTPSSGWSYCGGATIICASSLEEAIRLGNELKNSTDDAGDDLSLIAETSSRDSGFFAEGRGGVGHWIFVEEFVLAAPRPVGLVFTDANYA